ncbi:MAG: energy-coupling factor transporter ATPase [Lachnospiraceae bacterium]|nr:energy-coupling factor transporter ATPase [Lachnospiraceae bacterium]
MGIKLEHVSHIFNPGTTFEKAALRNICLEIGEGEFIGLIGHTGSGKSTLVQHMNGLIKPMAGTVYYDGQDICADGFDLKKLRTEVGLVFQYPEYQLFETSVTKDVLFGPNNMGLPQLEAEMRTYEALKAVGIDEDLLDASPFDLSGGQKRRVAIAGVLAMKPKVLILDEPAAGLDPGGRREILDMIAGIRRERNISVVLVSHSMEDVAEYVDRIIVMNDGYIAMDGTPHDIFTRGEELEAMGLDVPDVTRLFMRLKAEGIGVRTDIFTLEQAEAELGRLIR